MTWKLREEMTQREMEAFETLYKKLGIDDMHGSFTINGAIVRAAVETGWVTGLEVDKIPDMSAAAVKKLGTTINKLYVSLGEIDPKM
jgi:hypothetical protein